MPQLDNGLFSHVFFETGNLNSALPFLRWNYHSSSSDIYDIASITKGVATGPLIIDYMLNNRLGESSTVSDWVSIEKMDPQISRTKISDLLEHKSGLRPWINLYVNNLLNLNQNLDQPNRSEILDEILIRKDLFRSGDNIYVDCYSDVGFIVLGRMLELHSGKGLDVLWSEFKNRVLGQIPNIGYRNQFSNSNDPFISTGFCKIRQRETKGEVYDENCATLGGITGHCGLFSDGPTLCHYLKTLFRSKLGAELFDRIDNALATGFRKGDDSASSTFGSGKAFGHYGFTGTAFWINPETKNYVVFLSNRTISGRTSTKIRPLREQVFSLAERICCLA